MKRYFLQLIFPLAVLSCAGTVTADQANPQLADLEFMTGHWVAPDSDFAEEVWLAGRGGTKTGSFRWVIPNGPHVLEYTVIEQTEQGIVLRFKHLRPDYTAWEQEPNIYELTEMAPGHAVFSNRGTNTSVPQRMIYSQPNPDELHFRGESTGDEQPLILKFVRAESRQHK